MTEKNVNQPVPKDIYDELVKKTQILESELEVFKQKSPIIGVRWFGEGGFGIALSVPMHGHTKIALEGYGDKAVIDLATWNRIRRTEHAEIGLLVRDDDVINELDFTGVVAIPDKAHPGPNSFTNQEATELLKGSIKIIRNASENLTSHWGAIRLLKHANDIGITDKSKLAILQQKRDELSIRFRWTLLHRHDLIQACEQRNIRGWEDMSVEDMIDVLAEEEFKHLISNE